MPFAWVGAGAAVVGAATQVAGALSKGSGQSGAISAGQTAANAALQPYQTSGVQADTQVADLEGLNGPDAATAAMGKFTASPGYAYQVQQGLKGIDAGAASTGMLRSGATIKAEETLGSNLANQDFGNYVSRLNGLANYGITAAGGQASTDTSAAAAQSQIVGNQTNGIVNGISGLAGNQNVQNSLSSYFSTPGSSNSSIYATGGALGVNGGGAVGSTGGEAWAGTG